MNEKEEEMNGKSRSGRGNLIIQVIKTKTKILHFLRISLIFKEG